MNSNKSTSSTDQLETRIRVDGTYGADPKSLQDYPQVLDELPPAEKESRMGDTIKANLRVIVPQVGLDGEPSNYRVEDYLVPREEDIVREEDKTRRAELTNLLGSTTYSLEELEQEVDW